MKHRSQLLALAGFFTLAACAGSPGPRSTTPAADNHAINRSVRGEEFHVVGRADGEGDGYDATLLFDRANTAVRSHRCDAAVPDYDRLVREFPTAGLVQAAHYNRGVCLQSMGRADDAVDSFRHAAQATGGDPELVRNSWFRIAVIGESTARPPVVVEATHAVLAIPGVQIVDRVEALAREAAAVLAQGDRPGAVRIAGQAVDLVPTEEALHALGDDTYIAQARFILGEVTRLDAAAIVINVTDPQLERLIERRVQLVTHAHVQFNDAIRVGNPHWAAACGFAIGEMYRGLYDSIVNAPVPSDWDANAIAIYRRRTGERLRPLLQGALRAWEATQTMAQRNGIQDNDWVRRTEQQIGELRELVTSGTVSHPTSAPVRPTAVSADAGSGTTRR